MTKTQFKLWQSIESCKRPFLDSFLALVLILAFISIVGLFGRAIDKEIVFNDYTVSLYK